MLPKLRILEIADKCEKKFTIKKLFSEFGLDFIVNPGNTLILVAKNNQGYGSIGFLIAEKQGQSRMVVKWLHVKKIWRRLSVASALIKRLEIICRKNCISIISITFDQENSGMNRLTNNGHGWITGEGLDAYTFSKKADFAPAVAKGEKVMRNRNLQASIIPLSECNDQEVLISCREKDLPGWARLDQLLLRHAKRDLSRIFYKNNQIVGWLVTIPLSTETLEYRVLWVDKEYRNTGIMVRALAEVMRDAHLQGNSEIQEQSGDLYPWKKGHFMVQHGNQAMVRWVQKRLLQVKDGKTSLIYREKMIADET